MRSRSWASACATASRSRLDDRAGETEYVAATSTCKRMLRSVYLHIVICSVGGQSGRYLHVVLPFSVTHTWGLGGRSRIEGSSGAILHIVSFPGPGDGWNALRSIPRQGRGPPDTSERDRPAGAWPAVNQAHSLIGESERRPPNGPPQRPPG